jgi:phenylpropionate dioxygenase-like ring-hydroxylating dioxygenase large terminal subunit
MLVTQHALFRRFWYPVMPLDRLVTEPQRFVLLGQPLVLWLNADGNPQALADRCCHRTAQLSLGQVIDGCIQCPYHGWQFAGSGECVKVPQLTREMIPRTYQVPSFRCQARYGYAWVCLSEQDPLFPIPDIPEAGDPSYRQIHEFYEMWDCAGLRVMENEFDLAHPTFVHTTTFGSTDHPLPSLMDVKETELGLKLVAQLGVVNPPEQQTNLKMASAETTRTVEQEWFVPFTAVIRIHYPNGMTHIIVNCQTPISDNQSQTVQFCLRNDSEVDAPAAGVIAFDRKVTLEDKAILESTRFDVPLEMQQEEHMATDKPGILMRRRFAALLKADREAEAQQI